ncbi:MAG TPA: tRNA pseudouridine(55) synthase TruB [candidate division WOR-3 bacterium]|uniref:tRNA pseudouridine synthase B n=1 Tax=candidate division WOR-3 bacterium TaxID=2052148 RepID=A0A7V0T4M0_UNCW3|nr:tRNA pseudouridine(55) synthase TruB [candidate division WOR-3 bacterium]
MSPGPTRAGNGLRGILNVNKPSGITSYDVIRRVQGLLRPRRPALGHAGTLDPLASGVLLLLVGPATRVSRFLLESPKEYEAEVLFGRATDTDDITGATVAEAPVPELDPERFAALLADFTGIITQVPPRYSALKQDGVPAYKFARAGRPVTPKPRTVTVHRLELLDWSSPRARLRACVSSGTYIRALARDIGAAADSAATLSALVRTKSGAFSLAGACPLDALDADSVIRRLVPIEDSLPGLPRLEVGADEAARLLAGRTVARRRMSVTGHALARARDGSFLALVAAGPEGIRPVRLIWTANGSGR